MIFEEKGRFYLDLMDNQFLNVLLRVCTRCLKLLSLNVSLCDTLTMMFGSNIAIHSHQPICLKHCTHVQQQAMSIYCARYGQFEKFLRYTTLFENALKNQNNFEIIFLLLSTIIRILLPSYSQKCLVLVYSVVSVALVAV